MATANEIGPTVRIPVRIEVLDYLDACQRSASSLIRDIARIEPDSASLSQLAHQRKKLTLPAPDLDDVLTVQVIALDQVRGDRASILLKPRREVQRVLVARRVGH